MSEIWDDYDLNTVNSVTNIRPMLRPYVRPALVINGSIKTIVPLFVSFDVRFLMLKTCIWVSESALQTRLNLVVGLEAGDLSGFNSGKLISCVSLRPHYHS